MTKRLTEIADDIRATLGTINEAVGAAKAKGLVDLAKAYYALKEGYAELDAARKQVYAVLDSIDKFELPKMFEDADVDLIRIPELGRSFYPQMKYSARVQDKDALMNWLRERGQEDLISETVNSSTLAGYLKNLLLEEGVEIPEEIGQLTTYKGIGSSKYNPK